MPDLEALRLKAAVLREEGVSWRVIAKKLKVTVSFAQKWAARYQSSGNVKRQEGSGRKRKYDGTMPKMIKEKMSQKRWRSSRKIASRFGAETGKKVSHATVQRYAARLGLRPFHRRRRPLLTDLQKLNRLKFAKSHAGENWKNVLFVDESLFELYPKGNLKNDVVWSTSATEVPALPQVTHSPSVLVCGGVSYYGKSPLYFFERSINAPEYLKVLRRCLVPAAQKLFGRRAWVLVHDRATSHTAKSVGLWVKQKKLRLCLLPAKAPDVNIIEKVWAVMKEKVSQADPHSVKALKAAMRKAWREIPLEMLQHLAQRVPSVLQGIQLSGGAVVD